MENSHELTIRSRETLNHPDILSAATLRCLEKITIQIPAPTKFSFHLFKSEFDPHVWLEKCDSLTTISMAGLTGVKLVKLTANQAQFPNIKAIVIDIANSQYLSTEFFGRFPCLESLELVGSDSDYPCSFETIKRVFDMLPKSKSTPCISLLGQRLKFWDKMEDESLLRRVSCHHVEDMSLSVKELEKLYKECTLILELSMNPDNLSEEMRSFLSERIDTLKVLAPLRRLAKLRHQSNRKSHS